MGTLPPSAETGRKPSAPLPGPLKILVVASAPDGHRAPASPDREIDALVALAAPSLDGDAATGAIEVRVLDIADLASIGRAVAADRYHVVHLSAPMTKGLVNLEDVFGHACLIGATRLTDALADANAKAAEAKTAEAKTAEEGAIGARRAPLVVLAPAASAPTVDASTAELAAGLLAGNVERVVALAPTDGARDDLLSRFYRRLAASELPVGHVLAETTLEHALSRPTGRATNRAGSAPRAVHGAPILYLAGDDGALVATGEPAAPLSARHTDPRLVPDLARVELVGRRRELRQALRALYDEPRVVDEHGRVVGVVIHGGGGIGKSALAGALAARAIEDGRPVAVVRGRLDLATATAAVSGALDAWARRRDASVSDVSEANTLRATLADMSATGGRDEVLITTLADAVNRVAMIVVFDAFDVNLSCAGGTVSFDDVAAEDLFTRLLPNLGDGKALITSRTPLPVGVRRAGDGSPTRLVSITLEPLDAAAGARLSTKLGITGHLDETDAIIVRSIVGGHPGLLGLVASALASAPGNEAGNERGNDECTERLIGKLGQLRRDHHPMTAASAMTAAGATMSSEQDTTARAAWHDDVRDDVRDVLVDELVDRLDADTRAAVYAVAPSPQPVTAAMVQAVIHRPLAALATMLSRAANGGLARRHHDGTFDAHRWIAESLRRADGGAYRNAATALAAHELAARVSDTARRPLRLGAERHRESHLALELLLAGEAWDAATDLSIAICTASLATSPRHVAATATAVLKVLPSTHRAYAQLVDLGGQADIAARFTNRAIARYRDLVHTHRTMANIRGGRHDVERDLYVSCDRLGDLTAMIGEDAAATELYREALTIVTGLAGREPDRAHYQRDLSVAHQKLADMLSAAGRRDEAVTLYAEAFAVAAALAARQPDDGDHQRNLAVAHNNLGDVATTAGAWELAASHYRRSLGTIKALAETRPDDVRLRRDLGVSHERLGDLAHRRTDEHADDAQAEACYGESFTMRAALAADHPHEPAFQRDLATAHERLGDAARWRADGDGGWHHHQQSVMLRQMLVAGDPARADYRRELSISYTKLGELLRVAHQPTEASRFFEASLALRAELGRAEATLTDDEPADSTHEHVTELSVSSQQLGPHTTMGDRHDDAASYLRRAIAIAEALLATEPARADLRRELGSRLEELAMVLEDPEPALERLVGILAPLEAGGELDPEGQLSLTAARAQLARL